MDLSMSRDRLRVTSQRTLLEWAAAATGPAECEPATNGAKTTTKAANNDGTTMVV